MADVQEMLRRLNDLNDDYTQDSLIEDRDLDTKTKLLVLYEYGKQFGYGHGTSWKAAMVATLAVLEIEVDGIN